MGLNKSVVAAVQEVRYQRSPGAVTWTGSFYQKFVMLCGGKVAWHMEWPFAVQMNEISSLRCKRLVNVPCSTSCSQVMAAIDKTGSE